MQGAVNSPLSPQRQIDFLAETAEIAEQTINSAGTPSGSRLLGALSVLSERLISPRDRRDRRAITLCADCEDLASGSSLSVLGVLSENDLSQRALGSQSAKSTA